MQSNLPQSPDNFKTNKDDILETLKEYNVSNIIYELHSFINLKSSTFNIDSDTNMNTYKSTVPTPTDNTQAANKQYVDSIVGNNTGRPIGCIMIWATTTIPTNWLECNGQTVNQSKRPQLYAMVTTVPDLRGVFVRSYDNNCGYDSGRTVNSYQADNLASHIHTMTSAGNHQHFNGISAQEQVSWV